MNPSSRLRAVTAALALSGITVLTVNSAPANALTRPHIAANSTPAVETGPMGTPDCGGETVYNSDGTPLACTFDDEFDASTGDADALDTTKWVPQLTANSGYTTGPSGSHVCYVNTPSTISVSGGDLNLSITKANTLSMCKTFNNVSFTSKYAAGMVSTYGLFNQTYGEFEVRAKLPTSTVKGLQETLWLYPQNPKYYGASPASGEIDFAEFYSQYPNNDIAYIHYNYAKSTAKGTTNQVTPVLKCPINYGDFNTYGAIWTPGEITLLVNGQVCMVDDYVANNGLVSPQPFDQPFFIALTQALGMSTNAPTGQTMFPATTSIDYVRAWK